MFYIVKFSGNDINVIAKYNTMDDAMKQGESLAKKHGKVSLISGEQENGKFKKFRLHKSWK